MSIQTFGKFPAKIVLPYDKNQLLHLQQYNGDWTLTLLTIDTMIDNHYPKHSLLNFFKNHPVIFPRILNLGLWQELRQFLWTVPQKEMLC